MESKEFAYTKVICRKIPKSIVENGLRMTENQEPFDYEAAVKQEDEYHKALKEAGLQVILIEADESLPDCVFVEDTAVIIGSKVLITNPGAESRKQEVDAIDKVFENDHSMVVKKMNDPDAVLDGGDVMFTGKEIVVGLSKRTNMQGYYKLKEFFDEYPTHFVNVSEDTLHLKSVMSMVSENTISCGDSPGAMAMLQELLGKCDHQYKTIVVPNEIAANGVLVNGKLICHRIERFPQSIPAFKDLPVELIQLEGTEMEKVDARFTCRSILF